MERKGSIDWFQTTYNIFIWIWAIFFAIDGIRIQYVCWVINPVSEPAAWLVAVHLFLCVGVVYFLFVKLIPDGLILRHKPPKFEVGDIITDKKTHTRRYFIKNIKHNEYITEEGAHIDIDAFQDDYELIDSIRGIMKEYRNKQSE